MNKKGKAHKITKVSIRQKGFNDGYSGNKNLADNYIITLVKQGNGKNEIVEMIKEYHTGYTVGVLAAKDLNGIKIRNDKEYYNDRVIGNSIYVNEEYIMETIQTKKEQIKAKYKRRRYK